MSESAKEAQVAGRGVIYIAFAKMYFMVAGAVIEFRLPAVLSNLVFGAYAVVTSTVSPLNNVLITGSIQSVSRFTAQKPGMSRSIQRTGLRMHLYVGLPVAVAFIAMAPAIAYFYEDMSKTGPLMLAGLIVGGYSFYAVFVGTVNGRKEFHKQAGLDICMATLRAVGILGLAILGFGLYGALTGWVGAVAVILVIAVFVVGLPGKEADAQGVQPLKPMLTFFIGVAIYLILMNLIMFVDQMLLKRLTTQWYAANADELSVAFRSLVPETFLGDDWKFSASAAADGQVGYYRAVQNLARLSYQAIIAATFVIFPLVSRTTFDNDADTGKRYIRTTTRYSLIFAMAIAVVFAANPLPLLDIPYADDYAYFGAPALVALALGNVAFSLFVIAGTILNGAGFTREAIITAAVTLAIATTANVIAIPRFDPGRDVLLAAACATGGSMVIGAGIGGYYLHKTLGAFLPVLTVVRVLIAMGAAFGVGRVLTFTTPLMTLAEGCVVGLTFLVVLVILRELTLADLKAVTSLAGRKKGDK
jgi:O-antigen/teichoic acid export membrane protein